MPEDTGCTDRRPTNRTCKYFEEAGGSAGCGFGQFDRGSRNLRLFQGQTQEWSSNAPAGCTRQSNPPTERTFSAP